MTTTPSALPTPLPPPQMQGLREALEMQCSILGIEITPERTAELAALDTAALTARLRRTIEHRGW